MKKFIFPSIFLLLLPMLLFCGCKQSQQQNLYTLDCQFKDNTLVCKQNVDYVNTGSNLLTKLCFHLYPNAFRQDAKAQVVSPTNFDKAYPNGFSEGRVEIESVSGQNVKSFEVGGQDKNLLIVQLVEGIYPDERASIDISYTVVVPNINHRFGYGNSTINFGNFYPIACVQEDGKGFVCDLYNANGDPFYSDCANYVVNIVYPQNYVLASTGQTKSQSTKDGLCSTQIRADNVRDFAFVLSEKFEVKQESVDGIVVKYYCYDDANSSASLQTAVKAVRTFNNMFGKYPYSTLSVVQSNFVYGGMEYPQLVLISDQAKGRDLDYVIVHEIAHQWWYGAVGNNEYVNSWQDEGLTEFSTLLFYQQNSEYGQDYNQMIDSLTQSYKLFVQVYSQINGQVDTSMDRRLDEYETEPEYINCTYTKGVLMFDSLRTSLGEKKFAKCLKDYFKHFCFKNASAQQLVASFIESSGVDLEGFFASWIEGKVIIK